MKKRQRVRKTLIIISFLLFPVTLYYLCPILTIESAYEGVIGGSFINLAILFATALFLGRAFCGWACPGAGFGEICFLAQDKRAKGGKLDWIKYLILVPWIIGIMVLAIRAGGFHTIDPLYRTKFGISVVDAHGYIVFYFILTVMTVLSLVAGRRAFCHYACWMAPFMIVGTKIRNVFKWPALHLKADKEKCNSCQRCTRDCPMSLEVEQMVTTGSMENDECILCGVCVDVCPKDVIAYSVKSVN